MTNINDCKVKHILFILDGYPSSVNQACSFVRNLILKIADLGIKCTVITPQIICYQTLRYRKEKAIPYRREDHSLQGNVIDIFSPLYMHVSSRPSLMGISMKNHTTAVLQTIKVNNIQVDAVYGHFIYQCGLSAARVGKILGIPSFLAVGESDKLEKTCSRCRCAYQTGLNRYSWKEELDGLTGIVCVSEYSKNLLIKNGFVSKNKMDSIPVFINGVNTEVFRVYDRLEMRNKFGFPKEAFIISFVGTFNENKGINRLCRALNELNDENIYAILIGKSGTMQESYARTLFQGACVNTSIPQYLSASDVFVLPTRSEGCCNAIIEAMACGLPIISSDRDFNNGLLTSANSIRVNPDDCEEIVYAIQKLYRNPQICHSFGAASKAIADKLSLEQRAKMILSFINDRANSL